IASSGVVAIGRGVDPDRVSTIALALLRGGISAFELTLNEPEDRALEALRQVAARFSGSELLLGAGTVLTIEAAERAIEAGAAFLVSPHTDEALVAWANQKSVPVFPGAFTATEILAAWRAGATAVKLFPASVAGGGGLREIRGPLPNIPLIPTGGVTAESAGAFVQAGAVAVGAGGWLIGDGTPQGVRERAASVVAAVDEARAAAGIRAS
ncbi:MAG: bifunctional 4-hydroxy-2-oxoglutarate aldolase/2-dehydro-3-deoxy-phosphogluconate aldolase, partial [Chloroflexota bacterium]